MFKEGSKAKTPPRPIIELDATALAQVRGGDGSYPFQKKHTRMDGAPA